MVTAAHRLPLGQAHSVLGACCKPCVLMSYKHRLFIPSRRKICSPKKLQWSPTVKQKQQNSRAWTQEIVNNQKKYTARMPLETEFYCRRQEKVRWDTLKGMETEPGELSLPLWRVCPWLCCAPDPRCPARRCTCRGRRPARSRQPRPTAGRLRCSASRLPPSAGAHPQALPRQSDSTDSSAQIC